MRKQSSKSIEDLKDHGYFERKMSWYDMKVLDLSDYYNFAAKIKQMNNDSDDTIFKVKDAKKFAIPLVRPPETNRKHIEYSHYYIKDPFKFATDNLVTQQKGFGVTKNVYFYGAIRDILQKLFESGILQGLQLLSSDNNGILDRLEIHEKQEEYKTLTWAQLYPGFYIWVGALLVCIVVFIGEVIVFNIEASLC